MSLIRSALAETRFAWWREEQHKISGYSGDPSLSSSSSVDWCFIFYGDLQRVVDSYATCCFVNYSKVLWSLRCTVISISFTRRSKMILMFNKVKVQGSCLSKNIQDCSISLFGGASPIP